MNTRASSFFRVTVLLCTLSAVVARGQEQIAFCNDCLPSPPDRLVRDVNGNPLVGANYVAQLYVGSSPDALVAHTAAPAPFRAEDTPMPGTWQRRTITLTGAPGSPFYLEVRVWDTSIAATYNQAAASPTGQYGRSEVFLYTPCPPPPQLPPHGCELMLNFRGFTLMTNPPDRTLVIRENGERVDLLYSGTHTLQAAPTIRGPWTTIYSSAAPYTDPGSSTNAVRFYRMADEPGPTYSLNAVGYYRLSLCNGFSLIANQLHAPGGNTISNLFKAPPEGTRVYRYNPATRGFIFAQFVDGQWEGDDPEMTLNPGEGMFFWSSPLASHRFIGEVPMLASVSVPLGFSLISNPLPESGPPLDGARLPLPHGSAVYQWHCANRSFIFNQYMDGAWEGDSGGATPTLRIGEGFYFYNPGPAISWTRSFSVGP